MDSFDPRSMFSCASNGTVDDDWEGLDSNRKILFRAVKDGSVDELSESMSLLQRYANTKDNDGWGLLHIMAIHCDDSKVNDVLDLLVAAGCDINMLNKYQETPLLNAIFYNRNVVIKALLNHKARVDICDWAGTTALEKAKKSFGNEELKKVTIQLVEQAVKSQSNIPNPEADDLREEGNSYFRRRQYNKSIEVYTKSLNIRQDYRTYSNRAACYLKLAQDLVKRVGMAGDERKLFQLADQALLDASKASKLEKTFAKAHYREAKAQIGKRDFPRAKWALKEGLKHCPGNTDLQGLFDALTQLGVTDTAASPFSDKPRKVTERLLAGAPYALCAYCGQRLPLPLTASCAFCAQNPQNDVSIEQITQIFLE